MASIDLDKCNVKITAEPDYENPKVVTRITLKVMYLEYGAIASLSAYKIQRRYCRGQFLEVMDEYSDELHQFSIELFDKNGHVRPWLVNGGRRSGTGCWNRDLDVGDLIYIMDMSVKDKFRHQGVGSWVLGKLVESEHVDDADTIICWPSPVGSVRYDKELWDSLLKKQIAFFRKNHFRRIGRTSFFGYSPHPTHPSRNVPVESDAEAQISDHPDNDEEISRVDAAVRYPLHFAVANNKTDEISAIIQAHYNVDPASIHQSDHGGFTPIFIALGHVNLPAIRKLLELGVREDLDSFNNRDGMTALEKLQENMRTAREFSEALLPTWDGHSADGLKAEFLVKRVMGLPTMVHDETEYVEKRKWGCTCGTCTGGWLSPRMRFRLIVQAGEVMDMMNNAIPEFHRGRLHENPDELCDNAADYLPLHLRPFMFKTFMFKTFYKGYQAIFESIYEYLPQTDLPLVLEVMPALLSHNTDVQFYIRKGGKYAYAMDAVTAVVKERSPLGDGTFDETWGDENVMGTDYTGLPRCDNDLEFDLVRRMVGLNPRLQWGPYYQPVSQDGLPFDFDDNDMNDEDDDDDDDDDEYEDMRRNMDPEVTAPNLAKIFG